MRKICKHMLLAGAMATAVGSINANAATIVLTDIGGVTGSPAERAFRAAAAYWDSVLTNDVTININVGYAPLATGILGSTGSTRAYTSTSSIYSQLAASSTSSLDATAVANLSPLSSAGGVTTIMPGYTSSANKTGLNIATTRVDNDSSTNNTTIYGTTANLKALGYTIEGSTTDASITFSSNYDWDFNPTNGVTDGSYDFISVAIHEIGHALGFTSGVDTYDAYGCANGPNCAAGKTLNFNNYVVANVLDLFRYSADGQLNWAPNQETYFSIDGGATELFGDSGFSSGAYTGDGYQASHWDSNGTCSNFIGILNPYLCDGTEGEVTASDLAVFDAIGWSTAVDVLANPNYVYTSAMAYMAVPEPSTWLQFILGVGAIGGGMRVARARRRARIAFA